MRVTRIILSEILFLIVVIPVLFNAQAVYAVTTCLYDGICNEVGRWTSCTNNPAFCYLGKSCDCTECLCIGCIASYCNCCPCDSPVCGGCFTGETEINLGQEGERAGEQEGETKQIKDLKPGDVVESFNPETGEITQGTVSDVKKTTREGYYILETESGEKVRVTAEHPFLAVKAESSILKTENLKLIDNFKEILSNTLTYKLITGLQEKVSEILR